MTLKKEQTHLIPVALNDCGFEFHHTQSDRIVLTKWLHPTDENKMPGFATHYVGVGGLVISKDRSRILAI